MTYNLGTVRTRVQAKLDNTNFDTTILNQFINDGQREIIIKTKPQLSQAEATYTTSIGVNTLTTSATDVLTPIDMRMFTPVNYARLLPYMDYQDVDLYYPNVSLIGQGPPIAWTTYGGVPYVVNNADAVYTLKGKYIQVPTELSSDSDVPVLPITFSELLVLEAYKRALEHDDIFDQAQVIQQQITDKIQDLNQMLKPQLGYPHIMRAPTRGKRLRII